MKVVIIDDEDFCIGMIEAFLSASFSDVEIIGTAQSVQEGIALLQKQQPDLVFLDIKIRGGLGFDILEAVDYTNFQLVFTTAYQEYAVKAFEFSAIHYLLKPIDPEQLAAVMKRCSAPLQPDLDKDKYALLKSSIHEGKLQKIAIPTLDSIDFIALKDIVRCEADSGYTLFHTAAKKKLVSTRSLLKYEELLLTEGFIRVHDKHLINLQHAVKYIRGVGGQVELSDGSIVDVSKRRKKEFIDALQLHFGL